MHPSRSTLEVKTRRLLVAHGLTDFVREFPLEWNGRTYRFDFCFERDAQRSSRPTGGAGTTTRPTTSTTTRSGACPARHGYRIVFATWDKVTRTPDLLIDEIATTLAA